MSYTRYKLENSIEVWFEGDDPEALAFYSNDWTDALIPYEQDHNSGLERFVTSGIMRLTDYGLSDDEVFHKFMESKLDTAKGEVREIIKDYLEGEGEWLDDLDIILEIGGDHEFGRTSVYTVVRTDSHLEFKCHLEDSEWHSGGFDRFFVKDQKTGEADQLGEMEFNTFVDCLLDCGLKSFFDEIGPLPDGIRTYTDLYFADDEIDNIPNLNYNTGFKIPLSKFDITENLEKIDRTLESYDEDDEEW